ncbi:MAG: hypothetical protein ABI949_09560 [Ilumatobacteraceae bacterium]
MRTCSACGQLIEPWFSVDPQAVPVGRCGCNEKRWQSIGNGEWQLIPNETAGGSP